MLFGPTVGDKIRLANTDLYVEIEKDLRTYGDELVYGGGKTLRDGMGLANDCSCDAGSLDLVNGYAGYEDTPSFYPKHIEAMRRVEEYGFKNVSEEEADAEFTQDEVKK